jgi:probable selenate reductase FAD-binding subunit
MVERFLRPTTAVEAVRQRQDTGGVFLAGGTELNFRGAPRVETVVSLDGLDSRFVQAEDGAVLLGHGITLQQIADSTVLRAKGLGMLCEAARAVGSRAIRCQATLGGNIATNKSCSDLLPALMVLGATVLLLTPRGEREALLEAYVAAPDREALVTAVRVPRPGPTARFGRQRFSRTVNDLATINVALGLRLEQERIVEPRLAIGGVAPTVIRIAPAEAVLAAASPSDDASALGDRVGRAVGSAVKPIDDMRGSAGFKALLAVELSRRALANALGRDGGAP